MKSSNIGLSEQTALAARLRHVYWIGGGSGAGKSTVARRLSEQYNLHLYSTDEAMADHTKRCSAQDCPLLEAFKGMDMDERWVNRSPKIMLETFHWFYGEAFDLIVEDLLMLPSDQGVIIEGFRLLPQLVKPLLESVTQSIWLLPTPDFRIAAFTSRGSLWTIPNKTSDPDRALNNLLQRDEMFTQRLHKDVAIAALPSIEVTQSLGESELVDKVATLFALGKKQTTKANKLESPDNKCNYSYEIAGPLVSVVVPTFNRPLLLDAALSSISQQKVSSGVEVIVVNDGGDSVSSVVREWGKTLNIQLVEQEHRGGPARARNLGVDRARGTYLAFLDDDDLWLPDHLKTGLDRIQRNDVDFVYLGAVVTEQRIKLDKISTLDGLQRKAYPYNETLLYAANFLHTGAVIVRNFRDTSVRFDESLEVCEDWDLWINLIVSLKYQVAFFDRVTTIYHQVPDVEGLVSEAQVVSPSKFSVAREYIHKKWPSDDTMVVAYREWLRSFEQTRDSLVSQGRKMPNLLFDSVLSYLFQRSVQHELPAKLDIMSLFLLD